jgi:hypothetical protein
VARRAKFTVDREPIEIELGGDVFTAPPVIPPVILGEMIDAGQRIEDIQGKPGASQKDLLDQMMKVLDEVFGLIFMPESAALFHERLFSREKPFDLNHELVPALMWLVEEYTERPTVPSPPSTTGLGDGGTTSTPGASVEASTPSPSPAEGSATPSTQPSTT